MEVQFKYNKASPLDKHFLHQYIWQNVELWLLQWNIKGFYMNGYMFCVLSTSPPLLWLLQFSGLCHFCPEWTDWLLPSKLPASWVHILQTCVWCRCQPPLHLFLTSPHEVPATLGRPAGAEEAGTRPAHQPSSPLGSPCPGESWLQGSRGRRPAPATERPERIHEV